MYNEIFSRIIRHMTHGIRQVGSRMVILCSALLMVIIGLIGKIGVFFASIPEPIIGGMYLVMFGIIAAVGIANLQVP